MNDLDLVSCVASVNSDESARKKRIVLLQGPVGPFFSKLQDHLNEAGWEAIRICFNAGDVFFHGKGAKVSYTGSLADWPSWIGNFLKDYDSEVILLFGDQRPIHRLAIAAANSLGVKVVCFEEGYLRPDFITMELGGNNACSPVAKGRVGIFEPSDENLIFYFQQWFRPMAKMATKYYLMKAFGYLRYPNYQHHRQRPVYREAILWLRNAFRKWNYRFENLTKIQNIVEVLENRYFVVALQVHDDLQLRVHGAGWSVDRLIEACIGSFAKSAPSDNHLVFKGHPLDRGHCQSRELIKEISSVFKIKDRVHFIDDGSLGLLSRHSRGMVTINSTSAMLAFMHNKPVFAFGDAVYGHLTSNRSNQSLEALARFWRVAPAIDGAAFEQFCETLKSNSLVNGSYYLESMFDETCQRIVARLIAMLNKTLFLLLIKMMRRISN